MVLRIKSAHLFLKPTPPVVRILLRNGSHQRPHIPCGPTVRATLAWGNAPGHLLCKYRGLKARAKRLIPNKPLIKAHPVFAKHRPHLRLKIPLLMMLRLPIDIPHQRRTIDQPHRKHRIPTLPTKPRKFGPLGLDPLRRRHLQPLHQTRHRLGPSQKQSHMHMVGNPAHPNANVFGAVQHRSQIGMRLRPNRLTEPWPASLRAKHNVHQHLRGRLAHAVECSAGLEPASYNFRDPGALPQARLARAFSPQLRPTCAQQPHFPPNRQRAHIKANCPTHAAVQPPALLLPGAKPQVKHPHSRRLKARAD